MMFSCAKSALPLGGGIKDEIPPGVRTDASTPNNQTNWEGGMIELEFDEWINLENKGLIIVSPPLEYQPEVELRGKRITFDFNEKEVLKENTTYVINFGQSITDYTENNPVEDLVYVMSTGDVIDSLMLQGTVVDAYTGEPVPGVLVQAYDEDRDSTLLEDRPFYATLTKEDGSWKLTNLKSDTFQIYVLDDQNYNYMYDGVDEKVGFLDSMIILEYDTIPKSYALTAFSMTTVDVIDVTHRNNQLLKVKLSSKDDGYTINSETNPIKYQTQTLDSLFIWFETPLDSNSVVTFTTLDSLINDTLSWRRPQEEVDSLIFLSDLSTQPSAAYPGDTIEYVFQNPISRIDTSKMSLIQVVDKPVEIDSSTIDEGSEEKKQPKTLKDTIDIEIDASFKGRSLLLNYKVESSEQYTLNLYSGAVIDMYNRSHDTITTIFKAKGKDNFSKIMLTFASSDSLSTFVLELYDSKQNIERTLNLKAGDEITLSGLAPDEYTAKMIKDLNQNGKWDTGDLLTKRQPEEIKSIPIEKLRENWDIELLIDWDNI